MAGSNSAIKMPIIAITTNNSISVKPRCWTALKNLFMAALLSGVGRRWHPRRHTTQSTDAGFFTCLFFRQLIQLRHVPDLDGVIAAPRDQAPAVGAERY